VGDADQAGVRIGVGINNAAGLFLSRTIKRAQLVNDADTGAMDLLRSGKADIYAGTRDNLFAIQEKLSSYRVLDQRFNAVEHAIALPRGQVLALPYVKAFVEEVKASGVVTEAIARHSIKGVQVARPASR